jgi:hypothetical protein
LSDLPNQEDFPFTDDVLRSVLYDSGVTVRKEIDAGHLFVVNHKISYKADEREELEETKYISTF